MLGELLPARGAGDQRIEVLRRFCAYLFWPDNRFEKMLLLNGPPATGKTRILNVLAALFGNEQVSHVPLDELGEPFRICELAGKSANVVHEIGEDDRLDRRQMRQLISGNPISARKKFRQAESMRPQAKLAAAANRLPDLGKYEDGLWRRALVLPCDQVMTGEADPQIDRRIIDQEMEGVVRWAVEALPRLMREGGFPDCDTCERAREAERVAGDPIEQALEVCTFHDVDAVVSHHTLIETVRHYVKTRLHQNPPEPQAIGRRLSQKGIETGYLPTSVDRRRPRVYWGIGLSPAGESVRLSGPIRLDQAV
jgi:P4 family phage/plasmid primase-like protien